LYGQSDVDPAACLEKATGTTLEHQLRSRLFRPLALGATSYPLRTALAGRFAHGYVAGGPGLPIPSGQLLDVSSLLSPSAWGAGQIVSNADDVTRFFAALLSGRLLRADQLEAMKTRVPGSRLELGVRVGYSAPYGLGLRIEQTPCGTAYGHDGDFPGYRNVVWATGNGRRTSSRRGDGERERRACQRGAARGCCPKCPLFGLASATLVPWSPRAKRS
jgi:D-alanyl-D-alanine carboxypeptidase